MKFVFLYLELFFRLVFWLPNKYLEVYETKSRRKARAFWKKERKVLDEWENGVNVNSAEKNFLMKILRHILQLMRFVLVVEKEIDFEEKKNVPST